MSNKLMKEGNTASKSFAALLAGDILSLLDWLTCIYMIFVLTVLPLYTKWDYAHIASDKVALLWAAFQIFAWTAGVLIGIYLLLQAGIHAVQWRRNAFFPAQCRWEKLKDAFSATDLFVAGYGAAVVLSYCFSDYREEALMGRSSWGMGALIQIVLVAGYFCISRVWKKRKWILALLFPVILIICGLAYLNRFGIYPIAMKTAENPSFISMVGNINWLCGYMVMPVFAIAGYVWSYRSGKTGAFLLYAHLFVCFGAMVTNGSSSGIAAMSGIFLLLFLLSVREAVQLRAFCNMMLILAASCLFTMGIRLLFPEAITFRETSNDLFTYSPLPFFLLAAAIILLGLLFWWKKRGNYPTAGLMLFCRILVAGLAGAAVLFIGLIVLNTLLPGSIGPLSEFGIFTFSSSWGSKRGATWQAGIMLYGELSPFKKLIGVGSDCMGAYLQNGAGEELKTFLQTIFPNLNLTNAHCEPLTVLIQNGVLGLICFTGLQLSFICRTVRNFLKSGHKDRSFAVCIALSCGMAEAAYMINNLFSFQQVLNGPTMFVFLGIGEAYLRQKENKAEARTSYETKQR